MGQASGYWPRLSLEDRSWRSSRRHAQGRSSITRHFDDLKQLSSGLYGPLIVLPPGEAFDSDTDRVLVISRAGPGETPIWLNGSRSPAMGAFRAGRTYRLRIINIVPENPPVNVTLTLGGSPIMWRPIAKDGADLPEGQRALTPARLTIAVGEDVRYSSCGPTRQET